MSLFKAKYDRDLIGKSLGRFHSDFASINKSYEMPVAAMSLFVGKKTYIDMLQDKSTGDIAFHCRANGIPTDVLVKTANVRYPDSIKCIFRDGLVHPCGVGTDYSIFKLYEDLYDGVEIAFDLCIGSKTCFGMKGNY